MNQHHGRRGWLITPMDVELNSCALQHVDDSIALNIPANFSSEPHRSSKSCHRVGRVRAVAADAERDLVNPDAPAPGDGIHWTHWDVVGDIANTKDTLDARDHLTFSSQANASRW